MENNDFKRAIQISDLSVDELMLVAKKKLKKPIKKSNNKTLVSKTDQLKDFVLSESIKSHTSIKVPSIIVYDRYFKWATNNELAVQSVPVFLKEFNKMFKSIVISRKTSYLLHPEGFNLSDSYYESIKEKYTNFKKKT